jgi:hypothetical protein
MRDNDNMPNKGETTKGDEHPRRKESISKDMRKININSKQPKPYCDNQIKTAKYNL